ncbi:hypothetical protein [Hymenobacter sp. CRA2]|uniref:hypothetical protein n=1 Tax=Hymenobacter sp. CRA2 TaxID=1955620 RepID=UPI00111600DA|nr:hypothetical protein [Hymenobacter sp. CRA2]
MYSRLDQASNNNGTSPNQVQAATLSEVELQLTSSYAAQNFDRLRSVTVYLIDAQGARSVLAQTTAIPSGATRLLLTHGGPSMLSELKAGSYYVAPAVELQSGAQLAGDLKLQLRYQVQARKP